METSTLVSGKRDTIEQTQVKKKTPRRVSAIKNAIVCNVQSQLEDINCEEFLSKDDLSGLFSKKEQPLMMYQQYMEGLQHMVQEEIFALEKKVIHAIAAFPFANAAARSSAQDIFLKHTETLQTVMKESAYRAQHSYTFFTQDLQKVRLLPTGEEFKSMDSLSDLAAEKISGPALLEYKKKLLDIFAPVYIDGGSELAQISSAALQTNHEIQMSFVIQSFETALQELKSRFGFEMSLSLPTENKLN